MAAPVGNKNASKGRLFEGAIRRAVASEDYAALNRIAQKLVDMAEEGNIMAIKEVADRLDGKVKEKIELSGDAENPVQVFTQNAGELLKKIRGE